MLWKNSTTLVTISAILGQKYFFVMHSWEEKLETKDWMETSNINDLCIAINDVGRYGIFMNLATTEQVLFCFSWSELLCLSANGWGLNIYSCFGHIICDKTILSISTFCLLWWRHRCILSFFIFFMPNIMHIFDGI